MEFSGSAHRSVMLIHDAGHHQYFFGEYFALLFKHCHANTPASTDLAYDTFYIVISGFSKKDVYNEYFWKGCCKIQSFCLSWLN